MKASRQSENYSLSCYSTSEIKCNVLFSCCFVCVKVRMFTFYIPFHLCICIVLLFIFSFYCFELVLAVLGHFLYSWDENDKMSPGIWELWELLFDIFFIVSCVPFINVNLIFCFVPEGNPLRGVKHWMWVDLSPVIMQYTDFVLHKKLISFFSVLEVWCTQRFFLLLWLICCLVMIFFFLYN